MSNEKDKKDQPTSKWLTPEGKPIRVLSSSLGIALLANAFLVSGAAAKDLASEAVTSSEEPQLVSWSTEEVKKYFDKNVDWNIPFPSEEEFQEEPVDGTAAGSGSGGGTTIVNNYGGYNSGFGWDDLLLYHMLFNNGSYYSSSGWYNNHRGYYANNGKPYKPRTYSSGTFQNKPVVNSNVRPKTSTSSSGTITRRSTSSKSGGIGGNSSGFSSSGSKSSSRSGGFGG